VTVGWAAAIVLGVVLLASGALKLTGWRVWREHASGLGLPAPVGIAVPLAELVLGAMLVVGLWRRLAALAAATLLVVFTVFLVRLLASGSQEPCACFGTLSRKPVARAAVVRNLVLLAIAVVAAIAP
jgi:uncharacterized membrane protein YphA (DoxX/SURF4 family)